MNIQTLVLLISAALSVFGLAAFFRFSARTGEKLAQLEVDRDDLEFSEAAAREDIASLGRRLHIVGNDVAALRLNLEANAKADAQARAELALLYAQLAETGPTRRNFAELAKYFNPVAVRGLENNTAGCEASGKGVGGVGISTPGPIFPATEGAS
jgi:hypothetical protein